MGAMLPGCVWSKIYGQGIDEILGEAVFGFVAYMPALQR